MNPHRPRKRFGQHFLTDPGVIQAIVAAISPAKEDTIVEIGPGPGALTRPLAARAGHLHAIELDRDLAAALQREFADNDRITIHETDALKFDFRALGNELRIVGNLPYNISTPLLFHLLQQRDCIADMHFMLQKEVVERMAAGPGSKAYGRLGIMLGCYFDIEALFDVDAAAFSPPPAVTSAIVRLRPQQHPQELVNEQLLSRLLAAAFSKRRKTLRNALKNEVESDDLLALGIDPSARPEQVSVAAWIALSNRMANQARA